jgi:hypothetical protein
LAGLAAGKGKNMLSICQRKAKPLELAEKRVMKLEVCSLWIPDLKLISSSIRVDERGYFAETYVQGDFEAAGLHYNFVQDNQSGSHPGLYAAFISKSHRLPKSSWSVCSGVRFSMSLWTCAAAPPLMVGMLG